MSVDANEIASKLGISIGDLNRMVMPTDLAGGAESGLGIGYQNPMGSENTGAAGATLREEFTTRATRMPGEPLPSGNPGRAQPGMPLGHPGPPGSEEGAEASWSQPSPSFPLPGADVRDAIRRRFDIPDEANPLGQALADREILTQDEGYFLDNPS
jgi:hypothetical protein